MKKILILGAGKSATDLIRYLLEHSQTFDWEIIVGDLDKDLAAQKVGGHPRGKAIYYNVMDADLTDQLVAQVDVVASVLPAKLHYLVAEACVKHGRHIVTPSYISAKDKAMDTDFRSKGLLFMGEMGLDPGIDHMSVMQMLGEVRHIGGKVQAIRSYTGALIAPESNTNPWQYKFTWAPMNVVLAGQGTAQYLKNGRPKYIPYNRLFELTERYEVDGIGSFDGYANRDSLSYLNKYNIADVPTFIRGTLRYSGYCEAWNAFVKLGWTNNTFPIINSDTLTYNDLLEAFLPSDSSEDRRPLDVRMADFIGTPPDSELMYRMRWLGLFDQKPIKKANATPAQILLDLLEEKWQLGTEDKDMIVMIHQFDYELHEQSFCRQSTMVMKGKDHNNTAIAATVGFPMAIMVKLILTGKVDHLSGVKMPIMKEVYEPCLKELGELGVHFQEAETSKDSSQKIQL